MARNYYDVLGVPRGSDIPTVKKAFRELAKKKHPDVNDAPDAHEVFVEINRAYQCLKNERKKEIYDKYGEDGLPTMAEEQYGSARYPKGGGMGVEVNLEDIFDSFFGGGSRGESRRRSVPTQGDDLRADLEVSFQTACFGGRERVRIQHLEGCEVCGGTGVKPGAKVSTCPTCGGSGLVMQVTQTPLGSFQTQTTCPTCRGTGQSVEAYCPACSGQGVVRKAKQVNVNIPCGVDDGVKLRVTGEGDAGTKGGPAGDLYIFLTVKPNPNFKRDGQDIFSTLDVPVTDAILGSTEQVQTIDDVPVALDVPAGVQPGTKLRMQGKGVPALNKKAARGDHFVTVNVVVPKKLSKKALDLVTQLKAEVGDS